MIYLSLPVALRRRLSVCAGHQVQVQVPANGQPGMTIQFQV
eukprot:COSAG04_NODE_1662_length_6018_cov_1.781889_3_plen_41_part_00